MEKLKTKKIPELLKSRISRRENGRGQRAFMALFKIYSTALIIEKKKWPVNNKAIRLIKQRIPGTNFNI